MPESFLRKLKLFLNVFDFYSRINSVMIEKHIFQFDHVFLIDLQEISSKKSIGFCVMVTLKHK